jgi:uridine kinase
MSRLTKIHYLKTCHTLAKKWREDKGDYAFYSEQDQRYIHDYFRPSEDLTDEQRLAHRIAITKLHPSLPAKAGRALKKPKYEPALVVYRRRNGGKQLRAISVRAVIRPQPDAKSFAQAILDMARVGESTRTGYNQKMEVINLHERLLAKPPKNGSFYTVAVDGRGGSGKTSLNKYLVQLLPKFDFINGDDYFEPVDSEVVWGAFNDERFEQDVIIPLQQGDTFLYAPCIWEAGGIQPATEVRVEQGICIERCFSFPMPLDWDLTIWVDTPRAVCLDRGIAREIIPEARARRAWEDVWQPAEDEYIARLDPLHLADINLNGELPFDEQLISSERATKA